VEELERVRKSLTAQQFFSPGEFKYKKFMPDEMISQPRTFRLREKNDGNKY